MTNMSPHKFFVLYADDDPDDLALVQEAFARYSNSVELITASDGLEAITFLNGITAFNTAPCLIILDINMPRLNGKETLRRIRDIKQFAETPVVLFSTSSLPIDREYAIRYQAGYITKPLDAWQVDRIAEAFLGYCTDEIKRALRHQTH